jgi:hypothetical protein
LTLFCLTFSNVRAQAVYSVTGKVADADTREPLAFVNLIIPGEHTGVSTDIDGKFKITSGNPIDKIQLTYVGYEPLVYSVQPNKTENLTIFMKRKIIDLNEVIILPSVNPAHRIIDSVLANRWQNDPEKLKSFSYTSYEKTIFTAKLDTMVAVQKDSLGNVLYDTLFMSDTDTAFMNSQGAVADTTVADSSMAKLKDFFSKQDVAIMETVVERKFMAPDRNYENVKANRISGFQDPIFVFLVSQIQSTSFYREIFNILDKSYINPISTGSKNKYIFIIEDTLYTERLDTVFVISYRPRPNTNFDGLEGVLYINSNKWALQNVIARPAQLEGFQIRIQQKYEYIDNQQWFPVQLNTDILFARIQVAAGNYRANFVGIGKSYIRDIVINPELVRRQFAVLGVDVDPNAHTMPDTYWNAYRIDTLSTRDKRTYEYLDSIGREAKFDKIAGSFETLMNGKIPYKFIDIDLDKIAKYDAYQGFYLGLGAHTNAKLSRIFKVGGYFGFGFKDNNWKYGADGSVVLNRRNEVELGLSYFDDVTETGGTKFFDDKDNFLTGQNWRNFLIEKENPTEDVSATLGFRMLRDFKVGLGFHVNTKEAIDNYRFGYSVDGMTILQDVFNFTEITAGFRFAFREKFIVTSRSRISMGTKYPVVWFQYTRGLDGVLGGDYGYDRFDLRVEKSFYIKYLGKTTLQLRAGLIDKSLPESNLYNGNGSYRFFIIYCPNSFGTMRMNEFLSDRYVALYFSHNFGKLLKRWEKFQPELVVMQNIGFGWLKYNENQYNVSYKTMENGYYESGFSIDNLLNLRIYSLGFGAMYRWGPYTFPQFSDNISLKISIVFPIGNMKMGE